MKYSMVLGSRQDAHAIHVLRSLEHTGSKVVLFDASRYPQSGTISWDPAAGQGLINLDSYAMHFNEIESVYWSSVSPPTGFGGYQNARMIAQQDATSMLNTFFEMRTITWFNPIHVFRSHKVKPIQLWRAAQLGLDVPDSYIGNDPFIAKQFIEAHDQTIFKPVYGGAETQLIEKKHCCLERLERVLKLSPVTLQAYVEGTNVRTFVIGNYTFSAEIRSSHIDFRLDQHHQIHSTTIPKRVSTQAQCITRALGMNWTAIDWRKTPKGDFVFLEANPSPMFINFEKHSGHPITECLVESMLSSVRH